ncbi:MAG: DUF2946 family protein [Pseudomonadota bacterium]
MFGSTRHSYPNVLTALAVVLSLLALGVGHQYEATDLPLDPGASAFLEAGGTLSDLCAESQGEHADHTECPVCQLTAAVILPDSGALGAEIVLQHSDVAWITTDAYAGRPFFNAANKSRAPPQA